MGSLKCAHTTTKTNPKSEESCFAAARAGGGNDTGFLHCSDGTSERTLSLVDGGGGVRLNVLVTYAHTGHMIVYHH